MSEGTIESNSGVAVAEPAVGQSADAASGTPQGQSGQANPSEQSASTEENFSSVDPKTLPPELQAVHKSMQADYTKKTQAIAELRKKAESFDKLQQDEHVSAYLKGLSRGEKASFQEQKQEAEKKLGEKISDSDFVKAFQSKDDFLNFMQSIIQDGNAKSQKQIESLSQQLMLKDTREFVDSFATELGKDGKPLRPDFNALDEDQLISGFLMINQPKAHSKEAYAERLNEAYGWAKGISQKYYEKGKSEALQIIQQKAASSTHPPTQAAKGAYTGPDPKKLTASEAFQMAKRGERIPQVYD